MTKLADLVTSTGHLPVVPLMGFPGVQITKTMLKQNLFNWGVQFLTIQELVHHFQPDGVFMFMDLSVEANALGLPVRFPLDESPSVEYPFVKTQTDLHHFYLVDVLTDGRAQVSIETIRLMARHLDLWRGAYVIGPYTLAALMMGATETAMLTIDDPVLMHDTLVVATHIIERYAKALAAAGADMIAILDPSAVMLSPRQYREFSGNYTRQIIEKLDAVPILHICGNTNHLIKEMVATGAEGLSLDSLVDFPTIAAKIPSDVVLIGNVNPTAVMVDDAPQDVYRKTRELIESMAAYPNFILSTGCDLPPETPLVNIHAFMQAGRGQPLSEAPWSVEAHG
ncbi:MAG TPA: uroporphyrinogen decarboxylase family protein [Aggregatilineaceae bacterium]|nr:uroporphyrinogen decarboxylase family protein [Aggregatilineaceae bacterium]